MSKTLWIAGAGMALLGPLAKGAAAAPGNPHPGSRHRHQLRTLIQAL
jgi:hypothetical protein